jgi:hypothetical protein
MRTVLNLLLLAGALLGQTPLSQTSNADHTKPKTAYNAAICASEAPPAWCSGSDIGAWVNAAFAAQSAAGTPCGEVDIPVGNYNQRTTIMKPRCARLIGQSAGGTTLQWLTPGGIALIASDSFGISNYPGGEVADITLNCPTPASGGPCKAQALYIGGNPHCTTISCSGANPSNPPNAANNAGDHQYFNRLRITGFGQHAIQFGNNAFSVTFQESIITNNQGNTIYFPTGLRNSGEQIFFVGSGIQNNNGDALDLLGDSEFFFVGVHCDYNISCGTVYVAHFYASHIEQAKGPLLTLAGKGQPVLEIYGGLAATTGRTGRDEALFSINTPDNPTFVLKGTVLGAMHATNEVVNWNGGGIAPVLDIESLPDYSGNKCDPGATSCLQNLMQSGFNCNFSGCHITDILHGVTSQGTQLNLTRSLSATGILQPAANTFAGSCSMNSGTSCTFTMSGTPLTNYLSFVSIDHASPLPTSATPATCGISGNKVKITAGTSNSLIWDCLLIGNPN